MKQERVNQYNCNIRLDSLSELQAAKWFLLREKHRHSEDIASIDKDLEKLKDIELPKEILQRIDLRFKI